MEHDDAFLELVQALRPWLGQLVFVGGWAHRLHRLHSLATPPAHRPIVTRDVDLALAPDAHVTGNIGDALKRAGFVERFIGTDTPPVTHYGLGEDDGGFYAEFLTSLRGDGLKRSGDADVAVAKAGITIQKLRLMDLLLVDSWIVHLSDGVRPEVGQPQLRVPNAVSFIVQKLLIHDRRKEAEKAQDILYVHDTLELFGGSLDHLAVIWRDQLRPSMPAKQARGAMQMAQTMFGKVTDTIREAARIPQDRRLSPENVRSACEYGLLEVLDAGRS